MMKTLFAVIKIDIFNNRALHQDHAQKPMHASLEVREHIEQRTTPMTSDRGNYFKLRGTFSQSITSKWKEETRT